MSTRPSHLCWCYAAKDGEHALLQMIDLHLMTLWRYGGTTASGESVAVPSLASFPSIRDVSIVAPFVLVTL